MGEEDAQEDGGGRLRLNISPMSPISRVRVYSYLWGVLSGMVSVFTLEPPPAGVPFNDKIVFVIRLAGNTILVGLLGLIVWAIGSVFGTLFGKIRIRQRASGGGGGGDAGDGEGGSTGRQLSMPSITRGNFYGLMWGGLGGILLVYIVPPPADRYATTSMMFILQMAGSIILVTPVIGGIGYLLAAFFGFPWIEGSRHFTSYLLSSLLVAASLYLSNLRILTRHTPFLGGLVGFCFILTPLLDGFLLWRLFERWRKEG